MGRHIDEPGQSHGVAASHETDQPDSGGQDRADASMISLEDFQVFPTPDLTDIFLEDFEHPQIQGSVGISSGNFDQIKKHSHQSSADIERDPSSGNQYLVVSGCSNYQHCGVDTVVTDSMTLEADMSYVLTFQVARTPVTEEGEWEVRLCVLDQDDEEFTLSSKSGTTEWTNFEPWSIEYYSPAQSDLIGQKVYMRFLDRTGNTDKKIRFDDIKLKTYAMF